MNLLFYAPKLTSPTLITLEEYSRRRFKQLQKFLPNLAPDQNVRIMVEKQRHNFVLSVEIPMPGKRPIYIEVTHPNLYAAIDNAYDVLKTTINRTREKRRDKRRRRS